jgi:hypothetical protein
MVLRESFWETYQRAMNVSGTLGDGLAMEASRKRENLEELATVTVKCTGKAFQPQEQHGQRHRGMAALPVLRRKSVVTDGAERRMSQDRSAGSQAVKRLQWCAELLAFILSDKGSEVGRESCVTHLQSQAAVH